MIHNQPDASDFGQRWIGHDESRHRPDLAQVSDHDVTVWGISRAITWNDSTRTLRVISVRLRDHDTP